MCVCGTSKDSAALPKMVAGREKGNEEREMSTGICYAGNGYQNFLHLILMKQALLANT